MGWKELFAAVWPSTIQAIASTAWPICILVAALVLAPKLAGLVEWLREFLKDRDLSLDLGGYKASALRQQTNKPPEVIQDAPNTGTHQSLPAPENWLIAAYEQEATEIIASHPELNNTETLKRWYAGARANFMCEWLFARIFHSQIVFLQGLNESGPWTVEIAMEWHATAAKAHENFPEFSEWFGWLTSVSRCVDQSGTHIALSDLGRSFLGYLVSNGLPADSRPL